MFSCLLNMIIHRPPRIICVLYSPICLENQILWLAHWKVKNIMCNKNLADSYIRLITHLIYWQRKPRNYSSTPVMRKQKGIRTMLTTPIERSYYLNFCSLLNVSSPKLIYKFYQTILLSIHFCKPCASEIREVACSSLF